MRMDPLIECPECQGDGLSVHYRYLKTRWYGSSTFRPEDRGSVPFTPESPEIAKIAEQNVSRFPIYCGRGADTVRRESVRLCEIINSAWCHHLNEDDVQALLDVDKLYELTHTFSQEKGWVEREPKRVPTAKEVNAWSLQVLGHDMKSQMIVCNAELKRLGLPRECQLCKGEGMVKASLINSTATCP